MKRRSRSRRLPLALFLLTAFVFTSTTPASHAQRRRAPNQTAARGVPDGTRPEVAAMLREIDARNIESTIRKLVSFGTRNTLSAQDDPRRGIGAARDWLFSEFQQIAARSDG